MNRSSVFLSVSFAFLLAAITTIARLGATDLDEAAIKTPTIRSEVERGFSAAHIGPGRSILDRISEGEAVLDRNVQARSDTDAFRMGLNAGLYLGLRFAQPHDAEEASFQRPALELCINEVFKRQAMLKLTDAQMDEIFSDRVMPLIRAAKAAK